jgi:hypothetical protein
LDHRHGGDRFYLGHGDIRDGLCWSSRGHLDIVLGAYPGVKRTISIEGVGPRSPILIFGSPDQGKMARNGNLKAI